MPSASRRHRLLIPVVLAITAFCLASYLALPASAATARPGMGGASVMPSWEQLIRVASLRDYNTRLVVLGTAVLGLTAGVIGSFLLLRKRALMSDALSHATLPGIGLAFIVMVAMGGSGKSLPGLLLGALISGAAGGLCVLLIHSLTRLKEDAALGIVLSVFFGLGVAILGVIQKMEASSAAGLESFIYGKTASMLARDAEMIAMSALAVSVLSLLLFKEFALLCFDAEYARTRGYPTAVLDVLMMALVLGVTVIGLQAVGLILIIALLIIPPSAARFWTERLPWMTAVSALIGAISGFFGSLLSALTPRLPAGAIIVLVAGLLFILSMLFGPARGLVFRVAQRLRLNRRLGHQNLLRALYECLEPALTDGAPQPKAAFADLLRRRAWSPRQLRGAMAAARLAGLIAADGEGRIGLTPRGWDDARRVTRNHRLWEIYLITHADVAPSRVDRDADLIEHSLGPELVRELESSLIEADINRVPPSPHEIALIQTATVQAGGR